ncbi:MAG: hypothetical protein WDN44_14010 [Sphingomonas sp.]
MLRQTLIVALLTSAFVPLTACNTVRGVGRDIESVGDISHCKTKVVTRNHHRVRVCR